MVSDQSRELLEAALSGDGFLLFDGAMGTQLQERGLAAGELPELLCLTAPDQITAVHVAYVAAGADVVTTNTFGANAAKLGDAASVEEVFAAAVACAADVAHKERDGGDRPLRGAAPGRARELRQLPLSRLLPPARVREDLRAMTSLQKRSS